MTKLDVKSQNMINLVAMQTITTALSTSISNIIRARQRGNKAQRSKRQSRRGGGKPGKANRITWEGEDPEILFKNAARERTAEAKQKLAEYIHFVYTNTTYLSSRGLELVHVQMRQIRHDHIAHVTIKYVKSGEKRPFYINMTDTKEPYTFRDAGESLLSTCLTIIENILSTPKLHKNTQAWSFTMEDNKLKLGSLTYRLNDQFPHRTRIIDLTREDFWGDDGEFIGERAIASLYTQVEVQDYQNLPPLIAQDSEPISSMTRNAQPVAGLEPVGLYRGSSAVNAVENARGQSFAQISFKRGKTAR